MCRGWRLVGVEVGGRRETDGNWARTKAMAGALLRIYIRDGLYVNRASRVHWAAEYWSLLRAMQRWTETMLRRVLLMARQHCKCVQKPHKDIDVDMSRIFRSCCAQLQCQPERLLCYAMLRSMTE